jgi:Na+/alanine symporter
VLFHKGDHWALLALRLVVIGMVIFGSPADVPTICSNLADTALALMALRNLTATALPVGPSVWGAARECDEPAGRLRVE